MAGWVTSSWMACGWGWGSEVRAWGPEVCACRGWGTTWEINPKGGPGDRTQLAPNVRSWTGAGVIFSRGWRTPNPEIGIPAPGPRTDLERAGLAQGSEGPKVGCGGCGGRRWAAGPRRPGCRRVPVPGLPASSGTWERAGHPPGSRPPVRSHKTTGSFSQKLAK